MASYEQLGPMYSRRTFLRLVSWVTSGGVALGGGMSFQWPLVNEDSPVRPAEKEFTYYVSNLEDPSFVDLRAWTGRVVEQRAILTWQTAYERNNRGFDLEHRRAPAGRPPGEWRKETFIEGGGTTRNSQDYQYVVNTLSVGRHQFRLKQLASDDGAADYSDPVAVKVGMKNSVLLEAPSPNPARSQISLAFAVRERQEVSIIMYDVLGRRVKTLYRGTPTAGERQPVQVDVSSIASGAYFIRMVTGDHTEIRQCTVAR